MIDYKTNKVPRSVKVSHEDTIVEKLLQAVSNGVVKERLGVDSGLLHFLETKKSYEGCAGGVGIPTVLTTSRTGYDVKLIINAPPYDPNYEYPIEAPLLGTLAYMSDLQAALETSKRVVHGFGSAKPSALLYSGAGFINITLDNTNTQGNKTVYGIEAMSNDKVSITFLLGSNPRERHNFTVGIQIDNIVHNIGYRRAHASTISFSHLYTVEFRYDAESKVLHDLTR